MQQALRGCSARKRQQKDKRDRKDKKDRKVNRRAAQNAACTRESHKRMARMHPYEAPLSFATKVFRARFLMFMTVLSFVFFSTAVFRETVSGLRRACYSCARCSLDRKKLCTLTLMLYRVGTTIKVRTVAKARP